jgi:hypothetical protein
MIFGRALVNFFRYIIFPLRFFRCPSFLVCLPEVPRSWQKAVFIPIATKLPPFNAGFF